ncbi:MAG: GNAT family N-acetyltransferase [Lachnospiraceae bacterium]
MAVHYRKLVDKDLHIFIEIRILQLQEEGAEATFDLKPYLQDYYKRHLDDNTFVSWLAVDENRIVGTSDMSFVEKPPYYSCPSGKIGLPSSMYVIKEYRRKGIVKFVLDKVVNEADISPLHWIC